MIYEIDFHSLESISVQNSDIILLISLLTHNQL